MSIISTPTLRKITVAVLVVASVTFGAAEIHKRLIVPSQQTQTQCPPTGCASATLVVQENSLEGTISQIGRDFLVVKDTNRQEIRAVLTSQTEFYQENATSSEPRQAISLEDLKVNQKIIVIFDQEPISGANAVSVTVLFFPPPKEAKND